MSTAQAAFNPRTLQVVSHGVDSAMVARAHRVALFLTVAALGTLPWLYPAGPGNTSPTDLVILPAMASVAVWAYLSREIIRGPFAVSIGLVAIAGCISGVAGPALRGSLVTIGYPVAPLIAVIQDLYLLCWCLALVNLARSASNLRLLLAGWVFAAVFWAALIDAGVIFNIRALSGIEDNNGVRAYGQFGDPNMAAGYFTISVFVLWATDVPRRWWLRAAMFAVLLAAMVFTGSNGGFLSLAVGSAFVALNAVRRWKGPVVALLAASTLVMVGAGATQVVHPADVQQWAKDSGIPILRDWIGRSNESAAQRLVIIKEAWTLFQQNGILGAGPGATQPILASNLSPFPHQAHDDYLASVVERGFAGGIALIVLICAIAWRAGQAASGRLLPDFAAVVPRRDALIGALLGVAVAAAYYQVLHFRHVWALLAVIAALQLWGRDWAKA